MQTHRTIVMLLGLAALPVGAAAQRADSLPFRAGQWGAEFVASSSFAGAGALRFLGPNRALVLDVVGSTRQSNPKGVGLANSITTLQARLGHRWYRGIHPRIAQFTSLGVSAHRASNKLEVDPARDIPGEDKSTTTGGGGFAELGASWFVTPQLSLGAAWTASVEYFRTTSSNSLNVPPSVPPNTLTTAKVTGWQANVGAATLRVNLYF